MGFLNIFPLSDVNFIITWLITPSIFLGSLPGFISDQLVFTVREKFGPLLFGEYTGKTLRTILAACAASFLLTVMMLPGWLYNKPDLTIKRNYTLFGRHDTWKA